LKNNLSSLLESALNLQERDLEEGVGGWGRILEEMALRDGQGSGVYL
jgi:hypothetical protein